MKSVLIAVIVAIFAEQAQAVTIKTSDPIPEKPNQYNRVCDELQGDIADCWAGNPKWARPSDWLIQQYQKQSDDCDYLLPQTWIDEMHFNNFKVLSYLS